MACKTVLVTGCTEGSAGDALATEFYRRGHSVFATSTDGSRMQALTDSGVKTLALDVRSPSSVKSAAAIVGNITGGRLDVLVNNAAIFNLMPLADVDLDEGRKLFDVNFFGPLAVVQAFLPLLMAADGESIVANVSSISATMCPTWQGMYSSSKAALLAMGNMMRLEFAPLGIKVVTIMSGGVGTQGCQVERHGTLPEDSLYKPLKYSIETHEQQRQNKSMSPSEYARQVVDDLTGPLPGPMIWRGSFSWLAWMFTWFGWAGMLDKGMIERSGLDQVKRPRVN